MQNRVGVTYSTMTEAFNDLCRDLGFDPFQAGKTLVSQDGRRFAKLSWECLEAFGYMRKAKMGRPSVMPEPWKSLIEKAGSVRALAGEFGVASSTLRRWASGEIAMSGPAKKIFAGLKNAME